MYKKMIHLLDITLFTVFNPSLQIKISPPEEERFDQAFESISILLLGLRKHGPFTENDAYPYD